MSWMGWRRMRSLSRSYSNNCSRVRLANAMPACVATITPSCNASSSRRNSRDVCEEGGLDDVGCETGPAADVCSVTAMGSNDLGFMIPSGGLCENELTLTLPCKYGQSGSKHEGAPAQKGEQAGSIVRITLVLGPNGDPPEVRCKERCV